MAYALKLQGISVPRRVVRNLIEQLDPEGVQERKAHKLQRMYCNRGPNDVWYCDGYDKLKPFGFLIHASIDGWSRKYCGYTSHLQIICNKISQHITWKQSEIEEVKS